MTKEKKSATDQEQKNKNTVIPSENLILIIKEEEEEKKTPSDPSFVIYINTSYNACRSIIINNHGGIFSYMSLVFNYSFVVKCHSI